MKLTAEEEQLFLKKIKPLSTSLSVLKMKNYISHGTKSTYDHCLDVAKMSFLLSRRLPVSIDENALLTGALLHDYYLYDWHTDEPIHLNGFEKVWHFTKLHGFTHPHAAVKNANRDFTLSEKEKNIIESHMWPLTITTFPRSKEAVLVGLADKICAAKETIFSF